MAEGQAATPAPRGPEVITTTVEASESTVQEGRNEIPVGVGGQPIQRVPWMPKIEALYNAGTYVKRVAGQDRCLRPVMIPLKGGTEGKFACFLPCVSAGSDGDKYCPEHDREVFRPNQSAPGNPLIRRSFNSAGVILTDAEKSVTFEKDGKKQTVELMAGRDVGAARAAVPDVFAPEPDRPAKRLKPLRAPRPAAPRRPRSADSIKLEFSIEELKSERIGSIFVKKAVEALGQLPAKNISQMQAITAIQEQLNQMEEG